MKILYVAGKYRDRNKFLQLRNICRARRASNKLWKLGIPNICPHMNSAFIDFADDLLLPFYIEMAKKCDGIYVMKNFETSKGTLAEIKAMKKAKKKVFYEGASNEDTMTRWYKR